MLAKLKECLLSTDEKGCRKLFKEHSKKLNSLRKHIKIEFMKDLPEIYLQHLFKECREYKKLTTLSEVWISKIRSDIGISDSLSSFGLVGLETTKNDLFFHIYRDILFSDRLYNENGENDDNELEALYQLIDDDNIIGIRYIIEILDIDVNDTYDIADHNLLEYACLNNNIPITVILLDNGANVNGDNYSPLLISINEKNSTLAMILIERGADIDAFDDEENSAIILASKVYDKSDISSEAINTVIGRLIDLGADIDDFDRESRTPLIYSCINGNLNGVKLLIDAGVDTGMYDKYTKSAMDYANEYNHKTILKMLE